MHCDLLCSNWRVSTVNEHQGQYGMQNRKERIWKTCVSHRVTTFRCFISLFLRA
jgi:hypothetical protein